MKKQYIMNVQKFNFLLKSQILFGILFCLGLSTNVLAQPTVLFTGLTSTTPAPTSNRFTLNTVGGFKQFRFQANQTAAVSTLGWAFHQGTPGATDYSKNWRPYTSNNTMSLNTYIPTTFANGAKYNTGGGGVDGLLPAITSGNYYTFNVTNNASADNVMSLLETTFNPTALSTVSFTTPANTNNGSQVTVTAATAPAVGENVYVRYSFDSYATSTLVQVNFSGTTGTAFIPCRGSAGNVSFYVYSSNKTAAQINTDVTGNGQTAHDMATLNLNNNAGSNYSYTQGTGSAFAGVYFVPSSCYATIASFVTALNAATITGPVTCVVADGYSETAPAGGFSITATGTAVNTITFRRSNSGGANPIITAPLWTAGGTTDGIIKIIGGDYITIDGFTIQENASNTVTAVGATNTMSEMAIGLFLTTATNGAQNNTIVNNTITLNSIYANSVGIFSSSASSSTNTALAASATTGTNSSNKIYSNTISNVAYGIYVVSPANTATIIENGWDIGGTSLATGNTITFGSVTTSTLVFTSVSGVLPAAITFRNCNTGQSVRFNTITSNSLAYAQTGGLGGIVHTFGTAPAGITHTNTISNNTITLTNTSTTAITGIDFGAGLSTGTIVGSSNNLTINQTAGAAVSAAIIGIKANYASATNTLNANTVLINQSNSAAATTSAVTGITAAGVGTTVTVGALGLGNTVTIKQAISGAGSFGAGAIAFIDASAASGTVNVNYNQLLTTGSTIRSTGVLYGVAITGSTITVKLNFTNNTINIDRVAASGTLVTGFHETTGSSTVAHDILSNTITFTGIAGTSVVTGISTLGGASATGTIKNINSNTISISGTTSGAVNGISTGYSYGNMNSNSITVNGSITGVLNGLNLTGTGSGAYSLTTNTLSLTNSAVAPGNMLGITAGATGPFTIFNNTFSALNLTGIITNTPTVTGIQVAIGTNNNIYNNHITNIAVGAATSSGSPIINGIVVSGGVSTNVYANKIQGLSTLCTGAAGVVNGILISGGTTNKIYNNLIGNLTATANANADGIRGISITSTTATSTQNIYYNTIYLAGTSTAATFGGSGIFHTINATATTSSLDLRNNNIVNAITPKGAALAVAYRRSAATLTNYPATANNNNFFGTSGLFTDGTNTYTTLATYKTAMATRDQVSQSVNPTFLSLVGSSSNFLHIDGASNTAGIEGTAQVIATYTTDYDGDTRDGSTPDIGADEFLTLVQCTSLVSPTNGETGVLQTAPLSWAAANAATSYDIYFGTNAAATNLLNPLNQTGTTYSPTLAAGTTYYWKIVPKNASSTATGCSVWSFTTGAAVPSLSCGALTAFGNVCVGSTSTANSFTVSGLNLTGDLTVAALAGYTYSTTLGGTYTSTLTLPNSAGAVNATVFVKLTPTAAVSYNGNISVSGGGATSQNIAASGTGVASFGGTYTVGTAGNYPTLTAAVAAYNSAVCVTSNIVFNLTDATYSASETFPISINVNANVGAYTLTIKPASGNTAAITGSVASDALLKINGADNVTMDGSNNGTTTRNLTINNTNATAPTGISLVSLGIGVGATNNTVKNCIITNTTPAGYGIAIGGTLPGTTGADNDNVTISNNSISSTLVGIYAFGTTGVTAGANDNLSITGNTISNITGALQNYGIQVGGSITSSVSQNTIDILTTGSVQPVGISAETNYLSSSITKNNITRVNTTATGGYGGRGITVGTGSATSALLIANNFISGVNSASNYSAFVNSSSMGIGIGVLGGGALTTVTGGVNIYHNSVYLNGSYTYAANCLTTALYIGSGASALNIRNNIFNNTLNNTNASGAASKNYAIYSAVANTAFTSINYNNYSVAATSQGILSFLTADANSLSALQTAFGQNANSNIDLPPFVSTSNLHINNVGANVASFFQTGQSGTLVTDDYDGDIRATNPCIGADEFTLPACSGTPLAGTAAISNASSCAGATVTLTNSGYTVASSMQYTWETSADGSTGWTAVGAPTAFYGNLTQAITTTTFYRLKVVCTVSSQTVYSNVVSHSVSNTSGDVYTWMPSLVTGFNADVIANGVGNASASATQVDLGNYSLLSADFKATSASAVPTYALPVSGIINSAANAGVRYQLASSNLNNSLRLVTGTMSGTLTLTNPASARTIGLLVTSGSGASSFNAQVNFSDGTNQIFLGNNVTDWFGSGYAIAGIGRVFLTDNTFGGSTATQPGLYDVILSLNAVNQTKTISSILITKTDAVASALNVMGVSLNSPSQNSVVCNGQSRILTVPNASSGVTFQWQSSTDNITFTDIPSATTNTYTTPTLTSAGAMYYRCATICGASTAYSTPIQFAVNGLSSVSVDLTQICTGQVSTGTALPATNSTYFWSDLLGTNQTASITNPGTYIVNVNNNGCISANSVTVGVNPAASTAPVSAAGSSAATYSFNANWASVAGATSYILDVSTVNTFATFVSGYNGLDVGNVLTYSVTGLSAGTAYFYRVRSTNGSCAGLNSAVQTISTLTITSASSGNWNNGSIWSGGQVPTCADNITILTGHTVTVNTASNVSKNCTINLGGTLVVASGDLTVGCTLNNTPLTNNGTLTVTGGTLNVNGNIACASTFNQSGGSIIIDGNNGGSATGSVAAGTAMLSITSSALNLTAGTIIIVDPNAGASGLAFDYSNGTNYNMPVGSTHTMQFGNGTSTDATAFASGFRHSTWTGAGRFMFQNVVLNLGGTGNRNILTNVYAHGINGNLNIINGDYQTPTALFLAGNLTNNGTFTGNSVLTLGTYPGGTAGATANAQTISGAGTFRNSTTATTASLLGLTVWNTNSTGVTISTPLSISGTLTMTDGKINTTATNLLTLGTTTAAGTLAYTAGQITGPFARTFALSRTAVGTYDATTLFPVGDGTIYLPVYIDPTTSAGGAVVMRGQAFNTNSGTPGAGAASPLSSNRWEALSVTGSGNLTNCFVGLNDATIASGKIITQSTTAAGTYNTITPASTYVAGTPNSLRTATSILAGSYSGYFCHANLPPVITSFTPTNACPNAQRTITITGTNLTAATAVTLNGEACTIVSNTATQIVVTTDATPQAGNIVVTIGANSATSGSALTLFTLPTINASFNPSATICSDGSTIITASGASTYAWTPATGLSATTGAAVTANPSTSTSYTISGTDANGCINTGVAALTVITVVAIGTQPANEVVLLNDPANFTVVATGTGLTYQWQESTNGGSTWNNLANGGNYSGVTTSSLDLATSTTENGYRYRCIVTGTSPCAPVTSGAAILTISSTSITAQPALQTICSDAGTASFSISTSGTAPTYQWQVSTNGGSTWTNIALETTDALSLSGLTIADNGKQYRCSLNGGSVNSNGALLTVYNPPVIGTQPSNQTICSNATTGGFSVSATGSNLTYLWEVSTNGGSTWATVSGANVSGATTNAIAFTSVTNAMDGYKYRVTVSGSAPCSAVTSNVVTLSVTGLTVASSVTSSSCLTDAFTLTVTPTASTTGMTYSWSSTAGSGATTAVTANPANITPTVAGPYVYTLTASAGSCTLTSTKSVTVNSKPVITTATATPAIICSGSNVALAATSIQSTSGNANSGTGAAASTTYHNPFYGLYSNIHTQHVILASELNSVGMVAGNITSFAMNFTTANSAALLDLSIKIGTTTATNASAYISSPTTQIFSSASFQSVLGLNTFTFSTPYYWDGASNIVLDFCYGNSATTVTNISTVNLDNTSYVSSNYYRSTAAVNGATACASNTLTGTYSARPQFRFNAQVGSNITSSLTWSWNSTPTVATAAGSTTATNATASDISQVYTVTATNPTTGCFASSNTTAVTIKPVPVAPSVTPTSLSQCGTQIPAITYSGNNGLGNASNLIWYDAATAGNVVNQSLYTGALTNYFSNDFSSSVAPGTISGTAALSGGILTLTASAISQNGAYLVPASGINSTKLGVSFQLRTQASPLADGLSYSFGDDVSSSDTRNAEFGSGTKLIVSFDDYGGTPAAAGIRVLYTPSTTLATANAPGEAVGVNGILAYSSDITWVNTNPTVNITINDLGQLTLVVGGSTIFTNVQLPASYSSANKATWAHLFRARCGTGQAGLHQIDNVVIDQASIVAATTFPTAVSSTVTYYVSETVGSCVSPRTPVTITVTPSPTLTLSSNTAANCGGVASATPITITAGAGDYDTYVWSPNPSTVTGNATTGWTFNPTASTTYTLAASQSAGACSSAATVNVTTTPASVGGTATTSVSQICISGSTVLSLTGHTGSIQWQSSPDNSVWTNIAGAIAPSYTTPSITSTTYYRANVTNSSCTSAQSNVLTVTVNNPSVLTSTPATICGTGTATLGATASAGSTLNWYATATSTAVLGTGTSFTTPSISGTTNYFVSAAQGASPALSSSNGLPTVATSTVNTGLVLDITTAATLVSLDVYSTLPGNVTLQMVNSAGTIIAGPTVGLVTAGTLSTPQSIALNWALPVGTGYKILVLSHPGALGYHTGSFPSALGGGVGSIVNGATSTGTSTLNYFLYNLRTSTPCQSARTQVTATVNAAPAFSLSSAAATICNGSSTAAPVTITTGAASYDTYTWSPTTGVTGNATTGWSFNPTTTTNYTLNVSQSAGTCINSAPVALTVNPTPISVTASASTSAICAGTTVNLTSSANGNDAVNLNYTQGFESGLPVGWLITNAGTGNNWVAGTPALSVPRTGTQSLNYTYNLSNAANTWTFTQPFNLVAGVTYNVSSWYSAYSATYLESIKVTVGTAQTVASQTTTISTVANFANTTYAQQSGTFTPTTSGVYYFAWNCYSIANQGWFSVDDISITGSYNPPVSYAWTSTPAGYTSAVQNPTGVAPTVSTTYTVEATNSFGCKASNSTAQVVVNPLPPFTLSATASSICAGSTTSAVTVTAGGSSYDTYTWTPATGVTGNATSGWTFNPTTTTPYTLNVSQSAGICVNSAPVSVTVNPLPGAVILTPSSSTICQDQIVTLNASLASTGSAIVGTSTGAGAAANSPYRQGIAVTNQSRVQYLVTKAELNAAGINSAANLNSLGFNVSALGTGTGTMANYTIGMASTSLTALTATYQSPTFTTVYSGTNINPSLGLNSHTFTAPFAWDGTSNILINICHAGAAATTAVAVDSYTPAAVSTTSGGGNNQCNLTTGGATSPKKPVMYFGYALTYPITWSSTGTSDIFTNAGATTSYAAGANVGTVYVKPPVTSTYTATATTTNSCSTSSTQVVTIQNATNATVASTVGSALVTGDYLWNGRLSSSWETVSNWYKYDGSSFVISSSVPATSDRVFVLTNANAGSSCISAINPATVNVLVGTGLAKDVYIGTGATMLMDPANVLEVSGNWTNNGTFTPNATSSVKFNGTGAQAIRGTTTTTFTNLEVNKSAGLLTLNTAANVSSLLAMTAGDIATTATNLLTVGISAAAPASLAWTSGSVLGPIKRFFSSTASATQASGIFPVGLSGVNRNAQVNYTGGLTTGGSITAEYKSGLTPVNNVVIPNPPGPDVTYLNYAGLPQVVNGHMITNYENEGYWDIAPGSGLEGGNLNSAQYSLKLRGNALSTVTTGAMSQLRMIKSTSHTSWDNVGVGNYSFPTNISGTESDFTITNSAMTGFSWFNIGSGSISWLPIELVNFAANCNEKSQVDVKWTTASEQNSQSFIIERSRDLAIWEFVSEVVAAGNSSSALNYTALDTDPFSGVTYYRMKQVDFNGAIKIYGPISASCADVENSMVVFPNPTKGNFTVEISSAENISNAQIQITDLTGKVINERSTNILEGKNQFSFEGLDLQLGTYIINLNSGNGKINPVRVVVN